jgi:hypothetical protein
MILRIASIENRSPGIGMSFTISAATASPPLTYSRGTFHLLEELLPDAFSPRFIAEAGESLLSAAWDVGLRPMGEECDGCTSSPGDRRAADPVLWEVSLLGVFGELLPHRKVSDEERWIGAAVFVPVSSTELKNFFFSFFISQTI